MSLSDVPEAPDESCRHRETVRLPRSTAREIQRLVDEGHYPNRSAAIRAGVRLLIEYEARKAEQSNDPDESGDSSQPAMAPSEDVTNRGDAR